jgi:hypothetical protein
MVRRMKRSQVVSLVVVAFALTGCTTMTSLARQSFGLAPVNDPSVSLKSAETRWLLVQNPRFGNVASEPEYIWVEEDKVPFSLKRLVGVSTLAPPEIVSQYGPPPGGGKISARQKMGFQATVAAPSPSDRVKGADVKAISAPVPDAPKRGFVVWADTTRIAIDLTARDGVKPGTMVSLRRDRIPIVHPITGEVLGDLDEEVATARVTEIRDKFSVAEIQTMAPGSHVQVKDRVVLK